MNKEFENYLKQTNMSANTISAYMFAVRFYELTYKDWNKRNLLLCKNYLIETYMPKTVNLRIQAINKYLKFIKRDKLKLKAIKVQQKTYLENVISDADYRLLKNNLKKDGDWNWYFVVRYLAATGARVSELIQIKVEHVEAGYFDIYAKGCKVRRLYIPKKLRDETLVWLAAKQYHSSNLFLNRFGEIITSRGIRNI